MKYIGTRNKNISYTSSEAILKGICDDGGLFIPSDIPFMDIPLCEIVNLDYKEMAYEVMKFYMDDFTEYELKYCINSAYDSKFDDLLIAPLKKRNDTYILELFHGKTLAFKDMALSILPYIVNTACKKNNVKKDILILTATSGDTGKAALEGFSDVEGTKIMVFYPKDGVSKIQKLQMTTCEGKNTCVVAVDGNFDDSQYAVKSVFTDNELVKKLYDFGYILSSANSINIGRLIPQIVYYFYSYAQMVNNNYIKIGEKINFSVPTGNFGNILAGYYAKCMGLPINKLICASNDNKVLYDFFNTGIYDKNRKFFVTISPSMDILVSSNLERLICKLTSQEDTKYVMDLLSKNGKYSVDIKNDDIVGEFANESEILYSIKYMYKNTGYVMDTHTAVAYSSYQKYQIKTNDKTKTVIVSTASPYKFTKDVLCAIDSKYKDYDDITLMSELEKISNVDIPNSIKDIQNKEILHNDICKKENIKDLIMNKIMGV